MPSRADTSDAPTTTSAHASGRWSRLRRRQEATASGAQPLHLIGVRQSTPSRLEVVPAGFDHGHGGASSLAVVSVGPCDALLEPADGRLARAARSGLSAVRACAVRAADASPPATLYVVASLVLVWILERLLAGQVHGGQTVDYLALGALPNADIVGHGSPSQLWRWVSSGLVHDDTNPLHLLSNSVVLIMVGSVIERLYGRLVVLSTLALGVAAGSLTWLEASALGLAAEPDYTIGLSAGICALVGIMVVYAYRERRHLSDEISREMKAQAVLAIALMLLIGIAVPNLNNLAHAGGLATGALIALCLPAKQVGRTLALGWRTRISLSIVLVVAAISVLLAAQNLIGRLLLHA